MPVTTTIPHSSQQMTTNTKVTGMKFKIYFKKQIAEIIENLKLKTL